VKAAEGMAAELSPEEPLGNRRGLSQRARTGNFNRAARYRRPPSLLLMQGSGTVPLPPPTPPPLRGGGNIQVCVPSNAITQPSRFDLQETRSSAAGQASSPPSAAKRGRGRFGFDVGETRC
jgi:hypothetical protein